MKHVSAAFLVLVLSCCLCAPINGLLQTLRIATRPACFRNDTTGQDIETQTQPVLGLLSSQHSQTVRGNSSALAPYSPGKLETSNAAMTESSQGFTFNKRARGLQTSNPIYVSAAGSLAGTGNSPADPTPNLPSAMAAGVAAGRPIWLAGGMYSYSTPLQLPLGVRIWGGYSADFITRDPALLPSTVQVSASEGVLCNAASDILLDGVRIRANRPSGSNTVYGMKLSGCSNVRLHGVQVWTSDALDGVNGADGSSGGSGGKCRQEQPTLDTKFIPFVCMQELVERARAGVRMAAFLAQQAAIVQAAAVAAPAAVAAAQGAAGAQEAHQERGPIVVVLDLPVLLLRLAPHPELEALVRLTIRVTGIQPPCTLGAMEVQALQAPMDPPPAGHHPASAAAGGASSQQVAPPAALAPTAPAAAAAEEGAAAQPTATLTVAVVVGGVAVGLVAPLVSAAHPAAAPSPSTPPPPSSKCGTAHWTLGMAATAATAALVAQGALEDSLVDATL